MKNTQRNFVSMSMANINNDNNSNGMLDSNDSDSNPECSTPFDKTYLIKQIINGNGKVYESYEEMKVCIILIVSIFFLIIILNLLLLIFRNHHMNVFV